MQYLLNNYQEILLTVILLLCMVAIYRSKRLRIVWRIVLAFISGFLSILTIAQLFMYVVSPFDYKDLLLSIDLIDITVDIIIALCAQNTIKRTNRNIH